MQIIQNWYTDRIWGMGFYSSSNSYGLFLQPWLPFVQQNWSKISPLEGVTIVFQRLKIATNRPTSCSISVRSSSYSLLLNCQSVPINWGLWASPWSFSFLSLLFMEPRPTNCHPELIYGKLYLLLCLTLILTSFALSLFGQCHGLLFSSFFPSCPGVGYILARSRHLSHHTCAWVPLELFYSGAC